MRISEKTLELNFCSQLNSQSRNRFFFFGLTQKQEAQAGFDFACRLGGRLHIFQMKASNHVLKSGYRRFKAQHHQLTQLQRQTRNLHRSVFYVFPLIGNSHEAQLVNGDILGNSVLLDVRMLPANIPPPTKMNSAQLRQDGCHYVDLIPGTYNFPGQRIAYFHSDPFKVECVSAIGFNDFAFEEDSNLLNLFEGRFSSFWRFCEVLEKNAFASILVE